MGMAASQARLLTLTARLNHIELESQGVTNSKIRLSDATQRASDEYIKALNKTELLYSTYNSTGDIVNQKLTGAALTTYGSLKNQYGIINSAGQIMVSELDGANFEESNNLQEFLDHYGLMSEPGKGDIIQVENPEYAPAMDEYNKKYKEWKAEAPDPNDEKYLIEIPGSTTSSELYEKFMKTAAICYNDTMNLGSNCYMHVLIDLMGPGEHTTSDGQKFTVYPGGGDYLIDTTAHPIDETMKEVTQAIKDTNCCGKVQDGCDDNHDGFSCGDRPCDTNEKIYQKVVDLYWEAQKYYDVSHPNHEGGFYEETGGKECFEEFVHIIEHDLKQALKKDPEYKIDEQKYNEDKGKWLEKEPKEPDVSMYIDKEVRKITKKDEAQWYINLWHRMNGESDFKAGFGSSEEYNSADGYASISKTDQKWCVLKDGDMNSPEYLKFALENGIITLEQVQFSNPSQEGTGVKDIKWTSIIWSSSQDISEQKNSTASTLAEVKYNNELKSIEAKDKDFDNRLKKLDTEHKAIQTEYDSIKTVIQKNTERTFKLFS